MFTGDGRRMEQSGTLAPNMLPTPSTQSGTFDLNNRQTAFNGQTLSYDANGNLTSNGINTFVWNSRNQLTQITQGGARQRSATHTMRWVGAPARASWHTNDLSL